MICKFIIYTAFLFLERLLENVPTGSECYFRKLDSFKIHSVFFNYSFAGRGNWIMTGRVDMFVIWDLNR